LQEDFLMNNSRFTLIALPLLGLAAFVFTAGCGEPPASPPAPDANQPAAGEHDHDGHAHEHGHSHGEGPHHGTIADWGGGKYHVEFTVDHDKQEATVYVLGDDAKTAAPLKAETIELSINEPAFQVTLNAAPQTGDPAGAASRFVGKHEKLGVVHEFAGSIVGEIDGTPYAGDFKEEPHTHDHK
jgi:hypothetical protein